VPLPQSQAQQQRRPRPGLFPLGRQGAAAIADVEIRRCGLRCGCNVVETSARR
jgi:hypothetical protein